MKNSHMSKLGDICSIRTGKLDSNAAVENGEYPFFTCAQETFRIDKFAFDTEAVLLGGNNANGIFPLKYYQGKFNAYQRTYIIESMDKEKVLNKFIYFSLRPVLAYFKSASIGATTQFLTKPILDNLKINLPEIHNQKYIVDLLFTYDDLIDNNRKRIQLLEESARLLFREWFVYFRFPGHEKVKMVNGVPEGWEEKTLGDIFEIKKGKNITKDTTIEGRIPVVAGGLTPAYYHNKPNVSGPVITISASGANSGYVNLYHEDIWASDCSYINSDTTPVIYYYYLLLESRQKEITGLQRGAAQPHVYPKDLMNLKVSFLPNEIANSFENKVTPVFNLIKNLTIQNQKLAQARDLLLPRLMNGTIKV